mmetsp:Transcript_11157/g.24964  ORF Transcript_11157/g.24964 Transcript_11157/m.24964 type:complete len:810 (+) Transcript_11157:117-2546(+)
MQQCNEQHSENSRNAWPASKMRRAWSFFLHRPKGFINAAERVLPCTESEELRVAAEVADSDVGFRITFSDEENARINLKVLSRSSQEDARSKLFVIPRRQPIELHFFRDMFLRLREQEQALAGGSGGTDDDEAIRTETFQRSFERLFYVLQDPRGFNARVYDRNSNGFVGWGEFCLVFKKRKVVVALSLCERVFLTMDNPDSSHLAHLVSMLILLTIVVSSCCFILSTVPQFQNQQEDGSEPLPKEVFSKIESICLLIFSVEYLLRLLTCWGVRHEVFCMETLLKLSTGHDVIRLQSYIARLFRFVLAPSNVIDLAAILPGVVGAGGGLVVLRIFRLTRVFRSFGPIRGPALVIAKTLQESTKALYVLAFNLLLGIVISGSLMYLAERGDWDPQTRRYRRVVGRSFDQKLGEWEEITQESPFRSIPHAFWWAIVTAATVGYGDHVPVTSLGYVIAVLTMIFSLVILALPVGVIGGTFSQVWDELEREKRREAKRKHSESASITSAIQKIDPSTMSNLLLVEVWNERFPGSGNLDEWGINDNTKLRPHDAEFMGQAQLELDLDPKKNVMKRHVVKLRSDFERVKRQVTGTVTLQYEWKPDLNSPGERIKTCWTQSGEPPPRIFGTLVVTLIAADHLINLDLHDPKSLSNPFCTVLCYPAPPAHREVLCPCAWRAPSRTNTLSPRWNVSHSFHFHWDWPKAFGGSLLCDLGRAVSCGQSTSLLDGSMSQDGRYMAVSDVIKTAGLQMKQQQRIETLLNDLMGKVDQLTKRVDKLAESQASERDWQPQSNDERMEGLVLENFRSGSPISEAS